MNIWLRNAKDLNPDKVAVIYKNESITYNELFMKVTHLSKKLNGFNRVGVFLDNSLDSVILIHALIESNVEMVVLNTRLSQHEIERQLSDVSVTTVITTFHTDIFDDSLIQEIKFDDLYELEDKEPIAEEKSEDDILSIMFTSGTTGRSKAVTQSYKNHFASHKNAQNGLHYGSESIWLMVNPVFHISGFSIVMRAVMSGCTLIIHNRFKEIDVLKDIEKYKVTHTSFVPIMLNRLMAHDAFNETNLDSLEAVLMGGANTTTNLLDRAINNGLKVYNSFGMTETCSQIVMISFKDKHILSGTVGKVNDNIKVDAAGQLLVKGDNVSNGYLNAKMEMENGFFNTGDIAKVENGYLYILDRRQDLIISGGENIYPKEIEEVVAKLVPSRHSVVVKRKDTKWGEVPVLLIEGTYDESIVQNLDVEIGKYLARYKQPKDILFVEEILHTESGKVSRRLNQERYIKD